jgi:Vitamin K epoxide reductase family
LGYISSAWDPFFRPGTTAILDSAVSRSWPISDAELGAVAYTFEVLMGFMGGTSRWHTMPWMVLFFGILTIPFSAVSVVLVILQPRIGRHLVHALPRHCRRLPRDDSPGR